MKNLKPLVNHLLQKQNWKNEEGYKCIPSQITRHYKGNVIFLSFTNT